MKQQPKKRFVALENECGGKTSSPFDEFRHSGNSRFRSFLGIDNGGFLKHSAYMQRLLSGFEVDVKRGKYVLQS